MTIKKVGKKPEIKDDSVLNNDASTSNNTLPELDTNDNAPDSDSFKVKLLDNDNAVDLIENLTKQEEQNQSAIPVAMTNFSSEFYKNLSGFTPAIEVIDKKQNQKIDTSKQKVQPASSVDLENLDESMILNMPEIKATSFKIVDILDPKPIDKSLRFRWANCKNYVAGNLGKYLALGFQVASVDDVDQKRTPIDPSMIEGTQVKYFDVVLLKINVIRLMELYKTNMLSSINKLAQARNKGLAEAKQTFISGINSEPGAATAYKHYQQALAKEPVQFFDTE